MRALIPVAFMAAGLLAGCNEYESDLGQVTHHVVAPAVGFAGGGNAPSPEIATMARQARYVNGASAKMAADAVPMEDAVLQRRIAENQSWVFEIKAEELESAWKQHHSLCIEQFQQGCEVIQANVSTRGAGHGATHATLEMRVSHENYPAFMEALSKGVQPIEKSVSRDDRTMQWADLQARKRNAEQMRDRLKEMIARYPSEKLSDLLSLERELNRVQSTLDSMEAQSRVLARDTEKVRLSFNYRSAPQTVVADLWHPLRQAWHNMGSTFAMSTASVMLFVAGVIPWVVILIPGWFILRRIFRALAGRINRRKNG